MIPQPTNDQPTTGNEQPRALVFVNPPSVSRLHSATQWSLRIYQESWSELHEYSTEEPDLPSETNHVPCVPTLLDSLHRHFTALQDVYSKKDKERVDLIVQVRKLEEPRLETNQLQRTRRWTVLLADDSREFGYPLIVWDEMAWTRLIVGANVLGLARLQSKKMQLQVGDLVLFTGSLKTFYKSFSRSNSCIDVTVARNGQTLWANQQTQSWLIPLETTRELAVSKNFHSRVSLVCRWFLRCHRPSPNPSAIISPQDPIQRETLRGHIVNVQFPTLDITERLAEIHETLLGLRDDAHTYLVVIANLHHLHDLLLHGLLEHKPAEGTWLVVRHQLLVQLESGEMRTVVVPAQPEIPWTFGFVQVQKIGRKLTELMEELQQNTAHSFTEQEVEVETLRQSCNCLLYSVEQWLRLVVGTRLHSFRDNHLQQDPALPFVLNVDSQHHQLLSIAL